MIHHASPLPSVRRAWSGGLTALALLTANVPAAEPLDPWQALTLYRFPEAQRAFADAADTPETRFGRALAWINLQPKTDAHLATAATLLQQLVADLPPTDERAQAALFYLARIRQIHLRQHDLPGAQQLFRGLMDRHPDTFWGQLAGLKWLTLEIYTAGSAAETPARLARLEDLAPFFTLPALAKDYHNIMANAYEALALSESRAYVHLAACWNLGVTRGVDQADFLARLGTLAERLGHTAEARRYYGEFLRRFARDERTYFVAQRLRALAPAAP